MYKYTSDTLTLSLFDGKVCSRCKQWHLFSKYSKDKQKKDGLRFFCKDCRSLDKTDPEYTKEYNQKNREQRRMSTKRWADNHREYLLEYARSRYQIPEIANRVRASVRKSIAKHKELVRERKKQDRAKNKEHLALKHLNYAPMYKSSLKMTPVQVRKCMPKFANSTDEEIVQWQKHRITQQKHRKYIYRARSQQSEGRFTHDEWLNLCKQADQCCLRCGLETILTADHVIPLTLGGSSNIENIQPLCRRCNSWKNNRTIDFREKVK